MAIEYAFVSDFKNASPYTPRQELSDFCSMVESAMPGVKTRPKGNSEAWVYNPYDLITMGYIGFRDFTVKMSGTKQYGVASDYIDNEKYSSDSLQRHMVMRKHLTAAVKAAVEYLKPPTPQQIAATLVHSYARGVSDVRGSLVRKRNELESQLLEGPTNKLDSLLMREALHLLESGHTFTDPLLAQTLRAYVESIDELAATDSVSSKARVILVRQNTVTVGIQTKVGLYTAGPLTDVEHYRPDEVPEHIVGRIVMLDMVGVGNYVPGVGIKAKEGIYYAAI